MKYGLGIHGIFFYSLMSHSVSFIHLFAVRNYTFCNEEVYLYIIYKYIFELSQNGEIFLQNAIV